MIERVYGRDDDTVYLTRIKLTPKTRWGQLYFHWFHRPDMDRAYHDHPWDFWTFPLRSYCEEVLDPVTGIETRQMVSALRLSFKPAEHAHIVIGSWTEMAGYYGAYGTFVWHKPKRRDWGFWVTHYEGPYGKIRMWKHWKEYLR